MVLLPRAALKVLDAAEEYRMKGPSHFSKALVWARGGLGLRGFEAFGPNGLGVWGFGGLGVWGFGGLGVWGFGQRVFVFPVTWFCLLPKGTSPDRGVASKFSGTPTFCFCRWWTWWRRWTTTRLGYWPRDLQPLAMIFHCPASKVERETLARAFGFQGDDGHGPGAAGDLGASGACGGPPPAEGLQQVRVPREARARGLRVPELCQSCARGQKVGLQGEKKTPIPDGEDGQLRPGRICGFFPFDVTPGSSTCH